MSDFYETQRALQSLTETNLKKEFMNVHDYCQSAIHFANRCDINISLKHVVMAELSASNLRHQAQQRYTYGLITKNEFIDIVDKSMDLVTGLLPDEVSKSMIASCGCQKA